MCVCVCVCVCVCACLSVCGVGVICECVRELQVYVFVVRAWRVCVHQMCPHTPGTLLCNVPQSSGGHVSAYRPGGEHCEYPWTLEGHDTVSKCTPEQRHLHAPRVGHCNPPPPPPPKGDISVLCPVVVWTLPQWYIFRCVLQVSVIVW